jgi:hypothetical protein
MCEGTTTVTSGPQRCNSNPAMSRANEDDQGCLDRHSLDGMQEVRGSNPLSSTPAQRPNPASAAPRSLASRSRCAATAVARPIRLSPTGRRIVQHGGASVVSHRTRVSGRQRRSTTL